jgi:hypothetical protein
MIMRNPIFPARVAIALAFGLAVSSLQAVGTISASATLSDVFVSGTYDYTLTLQNTGSIPIESFWYGWTTSGNNLPAVPATPGNSLSWASAVSGASIKYTGNSGNALAPNNSAIFTFQSTVAPNLFTSSPAGESVVYAGPIDFTQNTPGDSSPVFSPTAVPEPSTISLLAVGLGGFAATRLRRK